MIKNITLLNEINKIEKNLERSKIKTEKKMEPKQQTLDFILNFSKSLEVNNSSKIGTIMTNLN